MSSILLRESHSVLLWIFCFVAFVSLSAQNGGEWHFQSLAGESAKPRADASFVRVGEYGYLLGGTGKVPIQRYDPRSQRWSNMSTTLDNLHHFQAQEFGGKIYIIGALKGHYLIEVPEKHIYVYDPAADALTKAGKLPSGRERGSAGMVVHDGKFYLIGGNRAGHRATTQNGKGAGPVAWVDRYDPVTGRWQQLPDAPHARDHFRAVVANGKIYVAGGGRSQYGAAAGLYGDLEAAVDVYDPGAKRWLGAGKVPATLPRAATSAATALVDGTLVLAGGRTSNAGNAAAATYLLDVATGKWRQGKAMIQGRQSAATAVFGSRMYVASGAVEDPRSRLSGEEVYVEFFSLADEPVARYDGWVQVSKSRYPRAEGQMISYSGEFYHFNGFDFELDLQATNEKYNPATNTWTTLAPHPRGPNGEEIAATHTGVALVGDVVWVAGGRIGSHPGRVTNAVYLYDISDDSWSVGPALPVRIGAGGLARLGRKLHWVGGFDENAQCNVDDHWVYDLDNPKAGWQDYSDTSPMPEARNHFGTVVLGGKLYAVGGQFDHDGCMVGKNQRFLHVYDPLTDKWTRLADLPDDQSHTEPSTFAYNKKIYSLGGQGGRSAEVWEYDPARNSWTVRTDLELPLRLIAPGARVAQEHLYAMVGGKIAVNIPQTEVRKTYFGKLTSQELAFYPASLQLSGQQVSTSEVLLVNYSAENEVSYRIATDGLPSWLNLDRSSGTARESFEEVSVSVDPRGLANGEYSYTLRAEATGYRAGELRIAFTVTDGVDSPVDPDPPVDPTPPAPPGPPAGDVVRELECVTYGQAWVVMRDAAASGGYYLTPAPGRTSKTAPPADVPENLIAVPLAVPTAGSYYLQLRASATGSLDDSFYFRVNGGKWINWGNGLQSRGRFAWRAYPTALQLTAGTVRIEIAYRENGVRLDKVLLAPTTDLPTGAGPQTAACSPSNPETPQPSAPCAGEDCATSLWAEAECAATVGDWRTARDPGTGVSYRIFVGKSDYAGPGGVEQNALRFTLDVATPGTYYPYLRLNAPTNSNNSFWVRLDEGPWLKFWKNADGSNMLTQGFEWRRLNDNTKPMVFDLSAGQHILTITNRESGTALDKIYLSLDPTSPRGMGETGTNCAKGTSTAFSAGVLPQSASAGSMAASPTLTLYPNPTGSELTVELGEDVKGQVEVRILDLHGRLLSQRIYANSSGKFRERVDVSALPQGMYRLEVRAADQRQVDTFVRGL
ncbi:Kelch repeat-containing protein [Neolewinella sp.]|uniref:Kelch repeat-containing protein n=1 Tax=Neolewinella sp. TaxID=2993543 RepID=UPI003B517AC7